ncbi:MAG: FemAB family PEP-CTERM system-associated protein [Saccharospirillum sp.]|nr:FemAB family PEP-CTERM system-associated protein [Saccharospirillum sp.]
MDKSGAVQEAVQPLLSDGSASIAELKARVKRLQAKKGEVARQFKRPELTNAERDELKTAMKGVSQTLSEAQAALKQLLNASEAPSHSEPPPLPGQFLPATANLGRSVEVRPLLPYETKLWQAFVQQHAHASAYHHPAFLMHIQQVFGHPGQILAAFDRGSLVGGLPLTIMRSRLFGAFAVSVPYFNYGGPLSEYQDVIEALLEAADSLVPQEQLSHVEVRTTLPGLPRPCVTKKVSMLLALPASQGELDSQLGAKVRAQTKKAEPQRPEIRFGGLELLDDFYHIFAINMRDLGTPVYAKGWFRALLADEQLNTTLAVAYLDGKPVSTGFLLGHRKLLEIPWASTLRQANGQDMNMWLYRQILGFAIDQGYHHFDFGRSTEGAGTYRFKKQWGARPVQHYWYYLSESGKAVADTNPDNPKYKLMIATWKRLPVWLTRIIGPGVIKNVP